MTIMKKMMSKSFICFIIIASLLSVFMIFSFQFVSAADYSDRKSLIMNVSVTNDFTASGEYIKSITASLNSFPRNDDRQDVYSISIEPDGVFSSDSSDDYSGDADGFSEDSDSIIYTWNDPLQNDFNLMFKSEVRTQYKISKINKKIFFPVLVNNISLSEYVKPTDIIDITPEIRDLAASLSQGNDDLYEVEYIFAEYVRRNIQYDLSTLTSDVTQKSSWVLGNKIGVCDELTNLFISLNRAVGVPARFVSGVAYTELDIFDSNWVPHAWAEVYFPEAGWVPYDMTYGQYGFIDSGHVKMMESTDGKHASVKYEYTGNEIILTPGSIDSEINVIQEGQAFETEYDFKSEVYDKNVGFGSYNIIEVTVTNPKSYYLVADLYLAETSGLAIVEESKEKVLGKTIHRKQVLLKPYENKKIYWVVKVDDKLRKNYIYTFPVTVYNSLNKSSTVSFDSREDYNIIQKEFALEMTKLESSSAIYNDKVIFRCSAQDFLYLNDTADINCLVDNEADKSFDVKICMLNNLGINSKDDCQDDKIGIQSLNFKFNKTMNVLGINNIIMKISSQGLEKWSFVNIDVRDAPRAIIKDLIYPEYPEKVSFDEQLSISIDIDKASYSNPKNVTLKITGPTLNNEWRIDDLTGERRFVLNTDGKSLKPNKNNFNIILEYNDGEKILQETKNITIISDASFFENIALYFNQLAFFFR